MSIIKSLTVGEGDMFYIKHNSDSFSIIDCCLSDENKEKIVSEIKTESSNKGIVRFISTHPDNDHIMGLDFLDDEMGIVNFYCVKNEITKKEETVDFKKYCELRDSDKAFFLIRNCSRKWLNEKDDTRGSAGMNILWPVVENEHFQDALKFSIGGEKDNNISPIFNYSIENGVSVIWMGDLESVFLEKITDDLELPETDILFAPHHSRKSGRVPAKFLEELDPEIIIVGEAPSEQIEYYEGYKTITQNSAGEIIMDCVSSKVHLYVSNKNYSVDFLVDEDKNSYEFYLGTLIL